MQRYAVDWIVGAQRHLSVEAEGGEERTLKIIVEVADVLTLGFLKFVQDWLRHSAPLWRVCVPTDNTDENLIMIYPDIFRTNPEAEANWGQYVEAARFRLAALLEQENRELGLQRRPHPPLPAE